MLVSGKISDFYPKIVHHLTNLFIRLLELFPVLLQNSLHNPIQRRNCNVYRVSCAANRSTKSKYEVNKIEKFRMKVRSRPFPHSLSDWATTTFLALAIPLTFWFELWIVVPALVPVNSIFYAFNFVLGTFILFNVVSNMMALMLCNTSIVGERIVRPSKASSTLWKFCSVCESVTPPRSWHCSTCRVCILKRDHHCMFTGEIRFSAVSVLKLSRIV